MALDLKKMQSKLNALRNKGGGKTNFFKPEEGVKYNIRLLPAPDGDPLKEFWFHYEVGNSVLCPKKNFGEECAICNWASVLFKDKKEESRKQAKKFLPRQRFFAAVLVRGEEDQGSRVWGFGKTAYESMINLMLNPDYGDITDTEEGTDLMLETKKNPGQSFPVTTLTPARKTSSLCKTSDECKELIEAYPDFDKLNERKTTEQTQKILDEFMAKESGETTDAEAASTETTKYGGGKKPEKKGMDIDAAFNSLVGED